MFGACWTAGCWILWAALLVISGFLITIHFKKEIPVPDFLLARLEQRFREAQLQPRFGATRIDPTGTLVLEDVRIHSPMFTEPIASARALVMNLDIWAITVGDFDVDSCEVIGLDLNCPAMFSPSGMNMPVVRDLHATLVRDSSAWRVPRADFRIGRLAATIRGEWDSRGGMKATVTPDARAWVRRYYDLARTISANLERLAGLGETRLDIDFSFKRDSPARITAEGTAQRLSARGVNLENVRIRIDHDDGRLPAPPVAVTIEAPGVIVEDRLRLVRPQLRVTGEVAINPFKFTPGSLEFAADRAFWEEHSIDALIFRTSLAALPVIEGELAIAHGGAIVRVIGSADPRDRSLVAAVEARIDAGTLNEGIDYGARFVRGRRNRLRELKFEQPLDVEADVRLADGWKFVDARGRFRTTDADIMGVAARIASGSFTATPKRLNAENLFLDGPDLHGEGSYSMGFAGRDFQFLIRGSTYPATIQPWFTAWWPRFWNRFDFAKGPPLEVDLSIGGRWGSNNETLVIGEVKSGAASVYELPFDGVYTRIFIRDDYYDILEVKGALGDRRIAGSFLLNDRPAGDSRRRIRFEGRSDLEFPKYARLAGPEVLDALSPFVFEDRADIEMSGNVDFRAGGAVQEDVTARVSSTGVFRFFEFPVNGATFGVHTVSGAIDVSDIAAGLGGGRLTGTARSDPGPQARTISFNAALSSARMEEITAAYRDFIQRTSPETAKEIAEGGLSGNGVVNIKLEASGPASNIWEFTGTGSGSVTQAEFGRIRVLGLLSKLFEGTILNFTSFRLTDANGEFTLNGEKLAFSRFELTGPSARIRAFGNYTMPTNSLEFNATIFPFKESSMPVFGLIGLVLEPFSRALEVRLTGTLDKPQWAFAAGTTVPIYQPVKPPLAPVQQPSPEPSQPATPSP